MYAYVLTALTSAEIRSVDSHSSCETRPIVSVAATQYRAAGVALPACAATRSSQASSTPAEDSGSTSRQGSGTPSASRRASSSSSASAASSASIAVAPAARARASCWRSTSCSASARSTPDFTNFMSVDWTIATSSASWAAARRAAAAGLLSSCARPAAIVPSEARRSRFCSIPPSACRTGEMRRMTVWWTGRCEKSRRRNSSGSMIARRHADSATMRTGSGSSVSTEIAPIHVGATWRPTGSGLPRPVICVAAVPSSRRMRPGTCSCSSTMSSPGSTSRSSATASHSASSSSSIPSKRSTPRSSASVTGCAVMPRRGTGG